MLTSNVGAQTISGSLINQVRLLYETTLNNWFGKRNTIQQGINVYTDSALPSFIISVAAIESLINEIFLSDLSKHYILGNSPFYQIDTGSLERMEINQKLLLFPYLAFGTTLDKSTQPYQDFATLVKLRNEIVHYKMKSVPPKFFQNLSDRKIALQLTQKNKTDNEHHVQFWISEINCSEAMRWGYNTVCETVFALTKVVPPLASESVISHVPSNFQKIDTESVFKLFESNGINAR